MSAVPLDIDPVVVEGIAKFQRRCNAKRPLWEYRLRQVTGGVPSAKREQVRQKAAASIVQEAKGDLKRLESELNRMISRTAAILAADTVLFAVAALKAAFGHSLVSKIGHWLIVATLLLTAASFVAALVPLTPPILRAWLKPYDKREHATIVVVDEFTDWVHTCWLGNRRTPIITTYKKAHTIAVPLLALAGFLTLPALGIGMVFT